MPGLTVDELSDAAIQALGRARSLVLGSAATGERDKADRDPVTAVDLAVETALRSELSAAAPDIGFVGEETGGARTGRYWVLDPIDGTVNFTHGLPLCAVSLGLIDGARAVLAAVDLPYLDLRYTAVLGDGAFRNGVRLPVPAGERLGAVAVSLGDYATGPDAARKNAARMDLTARLAARVQRIRMFGSAVTDLAWVADGRLGATVTLSNKPWEGAVGALLAREAGAVVLDVDGRPHTMASTSTVAAAPGLVDELLGLLRA